MPDVNPEYERDDDSTEMVRLTIRVTKEARDDLYRFAKEARMKPTYYASLCVTLGHGMLRRVLQPELMLNAMGLEERMEAASEPTAREIAQVDQIMTAGRRSA